MAFVIGDDCVMCGTCAANCPAEAISEGNGKYVINADSCMECGTCVPTARWARSRRLRFGRRKTQTNEAICSRHIALYLFQTIFSGRSVCHAPLRTI